MTTANALVFADVLPSATRAIFVEIWVPRNSVPPFLDRETLENEIKANRPDHNLATASAIADVTAALRRAFDV